MTLSLYKSPFLPLLDFKKQKQKRLFKAKIITMCCRVYNRCRSRRCDKTAAQRARARRERETQAGRPVCHTEEVARQLTAEHGK